jgi:hypothetical protein
MEFLHSDTPELATIPRNEANHALGVRRWGSSFRRRCFILVIVTLALGVPITLAVV